MATKERLIKESQELVASCKAVVDKKRAELARYEVQYNALLQFYSESPPAFPGGASDSLDRTDNSVPILGTLDIIAKPNGKVPQAGSDEPQPRDSEEEASSQSASSSSSGQEDEQLPRDSEKEASSQSTSSSSSEQEDEQLPHEALASENPNGHRTGDSSDSETSGSPPRTKSPQSRRQPKVPAVKWTEQIYKRPIKTPAQARDTISASEDSMSSEEPAEAISPNEVSNGVEEKRSGSNATRGAGTQQPTVEDWATEASPEELFLWKILGLSGPWTAGSSPGMLADSCWSQRTARNSMPVTFSSVNEYRSYFEKLVIEECKASLWASWEIRKSGKSGDQAEVAEALGGSENRLQPSLWQFNEMISNPGDPLNYYEADPPQPSCEAFDTSDVLLLIYNDTTSLAIVHSTDHKRILLATLTKLQATRGQVTLVLLCKMVPVKRQYVSLAKMSEIWDPLLRQILRPQESKTALISSKASSSDDDLNMESLTEITLTWSQKEIFNKRQLMTLNSMLQLNQGFMLVQGPPGTGKTSAIVGMISAALIDEPGVRILVCATSNVAVDEIVGRLMKAMIRKDGSTYAPERGQLVRVGVKQSIQEACLPVYIDNIHDRNGTIGKKTDTLNEATIVCSTISGCGHQIFDDANRKFDLLIVDEAAQVQETELLIALRRVRGRCVMVGDPCQLPAVVVQNPGEAFGRSLFERMQEAEVPVIMMTTQYRMHPHISKFPSQNFYRGLLRDSAHCEARTHIFTADTEGVALLGHKLAPYLFLDVPWGLEQGEQFSYSKANEQEAEVVGAVVQAVVQSLREGVKPNIGVITPYLAQRAVISRTLESQNLDKNACEVNTVDGFQGREKDVIILSCVRAQPDKGIGFVSDKRRINVALTRARYCLIIVGHSKTLRRRSNVWNDLLADASERGSYQILPERKPQVEKLTRVELSQGPNSNAPDVWQLRDDLNLEQRVAANGSRADETAAAGSARGLAHSAPRREYNGPKSQRNFQQRQPEQGKRPAIGAGQSPTRENLDPFQRAPAPERHYFQETNFEMQRDGQSRHSPHARLENGAHEIEHRHSQGEGHRRDEKYEESSRLHEWRHGRNIEADYIRPCRGEGHTRDERNEGSSRQQELRQGRNSEADDNRSRRTPTPTERNGYHRGSNSAGRPNNPGLGGHDRRFEHGGESSWERERPNSTPTRTEVRRNHGERHARDDRNGDVSRQQWMQGRTSSERSSSKSPMRKKQKGYQDNNFAGSPYKPGPGGRGRGGRGRGGRGRGDRGRGDRGRGGRGGRGRGGNHI